MFDFINVPKIELHCHIDGSIRPETILELAQKDGIEVPTTDIDEFRNFAKAPKNCSSLKEYLKRFDLPIAVMQSKKNIFRVVSEVLEDASSENVKYIELRFAPLYHMQKGLSFDEVIESVLEAMTFAKEKFDIESNLILSCLRHEPVEKSIEVVEKGKKFLGKGVVAVDLAGNEHDFPPELHKEAFDLAKKYGYNITIHAGETGIAKNIQKSVELLHATRIGHGVFAYKDQEVYDMLKAKNIYLEMCPTSNVQTKAVESYESHPIKNYFEDNILVTLSTDNRTVSDVTMTFECEMLGSKLNMTENQLIDIYNYSVDACFASEEVKAKLRNFSK